MGYTSSVRIITSKNGFKELLNFVDKYKVENKIPENQFENLLRHPNIKHSNKYQKYFGWDEIKWYGFPEIIAIEKGLEYLKENNYSYRFARIGEDSTDYEEHYHDSTNKKEQGFEFPVMERYFDDEYVKDNIVDQTKYLKEEVR